MSLKFVRAQGRTGYLWNTSQIFTAESICPLTFSINYQVEICKPNIHIISRRSTKISY
jgi:hypothetical protein